MQAFETAVINAQRQDTNKLYREFVRENSMSAGLYVLAAGATDRQQPHTEDELYYVVSGRAVIRVAEEDRPVQPGSIVYVAANVSHFFHSITEELQVLVFFAPAEYSQKE